MSQAAAAPAILHDKPEQLQFVREALLEGEQLHAVFDCKGAGTGFMGLTDRRVILQDRSFLGGKIALVSLPFSRIASVAMLTNKSVLGAFWSSGELMIVTVGGSRHTADFRGIDKAKFSHDFILWHLHYSGEETNRAPISHRARCAGCARGMWRTPFRGRCRYGEPYGCAVGNPKPYAYANAQTDAYSRSTGAGASSDQPRRLPR